MLHSQAAIEAIPHLCVSEQNRPTPVWRRLSLTHAGLEKLNPGGIGLTSLINVWESRVFFCHSMFYLYSAHHTKLVPDWADHLAVSVQQAQMSVLI